MVRKHNKCLTPLKIIGSCSQQKHLSIYLFSNSCEAIVYSSMYMIDKAMVSSIVKLHKKLYFIFLEFCWHNHRENGGESISSFILI